MTNRQFISMVQGRVGEKGDYSFSGRHILSEGRSAASLFIKRDFDRRKLLSDDSVYTTIPCLKMIEVPLSSCCHYYGTCSVYRSETRLPVIGAGIYGHIISSVSSVDGSRVFTKGEATRFANSLKLGSNKKTYMYWISDGYLYVTSDVDAVMIKAFFESGVDYSKVSTCGGDDRDEPCYSPLDDVFHCPSYLISSVVDVVAKALITSTQISNDKTDDDAKT